MMRTTISKWLAAMLVALAARAMACATTTIPPQSIQGLVEVVAIEELTEDPVVAMRLSESRFALADIEHQIDAIHRARREGEPTSERNGELRALKTQQRALKRAIRDDTKKLETPLLVVHGWDGVNGKTTTLLCAQKHERTVKGATAGDLLKFEAIHDDDAKDYGRQSLSQQNLSIQSIEVAKQRPATWKAIDPAGMPWPLVDATGLINVRCVIGAEQSGVGRTFARLTIIADSMKTVTAARVRIYEVDPSSGNKTPITPIIGTLFRPWKASSSRVSGQQPGRFWVPLDIEPTYENQYEFEVLEVWVRQSVRLPSP